MATRVTSTRFIGRETELAELVAALDEAVDGRASLAFLAGESGVGKTRLLAELERSARERGARVIGGECIELGESELPYAPIVAALRPLARSGDPVLSTLSPAAREGLAHMLPGLGEGPRVQGEEAAQARLFEGLLELLDLLGRDGGLLLSIEDLHWADRSTRAFLAYLASTLCQESVLVVATYRPDELHRRHPLRPLLAELERDANARRVELPPLTRDELAQQLADILGSPPAPELLARLWARSEGNPLFAEELLAAGLDGRGALPPTLRDALMLRIEKLPTEAQELLRLIAAGRRVEHGVLADAAGIDPRTLRDALREAAAAHLIVADAEGRYTFRHALLREVVHDDLLPGEHAELHLALAHALESRAAGLPGHGGAHVAAGIAHHYWSAGDQPAALVASVRAAETADDVRAHGEAAAQYERALELWDRVPDAAERVGHEHVEILRAAADAHRGDHHPARAETLLKAALTEIDERSDPELAAAVLERLGQCQWDLGHGRQATETRERALALLPADEPSPGRAEIMSSLAKHLMLEGKYRDAVKASGAALEVARAAGHAMSEVRALDALGVSLFALGRHDEGERALRGSLEHLHELGSSVSALSSYVNLADALASAGRLDEARRVADEGAALARERGLRNRWLDLLRCELAFDAGDWALADSLLPDMGRRTMGVLYLNEALRRIELALGRGDHERARGLLDEAEVVAADSREPQWIGPIGALRAELERRGGDLDAARAAIENALDRLEFCSEDAARMARVSAAGVRVEADAAVRARDLGDDPSGAMARAESLLARVDACAQGTRPVEEAFLATARAEYARARGADDPKLWRAATAAWEALGRPYRAAQARRREAEALLAAGERDRAYAAAVAALEAAQQIGAAWLESEIEGFALRARLRLDRAELPQEEAEPAADDDPFGLTPRERQVLALLADGKTNREIGSVLYMAEKTASVHVSRILSKLDVRSRTEAAAVAHRVGLV